MVRALASHQCGLGSNPSIDAICGLSLLLVLSFAPRVFVFSLCTPVFPSPQKPTLPNYNSTENYVHKEPLCGYATSESIYISYNIYSIFLKWNISCVMSSKYFRRTSLYLVRLKIFERVEFHRRHLHQIQGNWAGRNFVTALRVTSRLIMHARMQRWIWNLQLQTDSTFK